MTKRQQIKAARNVIKAENTLASNNTSHVVHFILSVISGGLWIPVWILITLSNANERRKALNIIAEDRLLIENNYDVFTD